MKTKGRLISYLLVLSFLPLFYVIIKIGGLEESWMGLDNFWSLYKWVVAGSIPVAAVIEYFMWRSKR